ncbi:Importin-11 [Rhizophlyctis rosea]|uniref:Importin-11 n=1 Tax=Rhizophlyctis rosea TaxID=64517 RepID=A0AAD5S5U0_9FUNG|nr:Importin-11 [Rhizophlyctis rosea]
MSAFEQIVTVLQQACAPASSIRLPAEEQLRQWEAFPSYYATLQEIAYDRSIPETIRQLAMLGLKNGVHKYWRKQAAGKPGAISPEEKAQIRSKVLNIMDEAMRGVATQNAVFVSKIAAIDYPQEWPDLLNNLIQIVQSTFNPPATPTDAIRNRTIQHNALYTLYLVIKETGSKQMPTKKRMFQQIAPDIFRYSALLYYERSNQFFGFAQAMVEGRQGIDYEEAVQTLKVAYAGLKCLRRTIVFGFQAFETVEEPSRLFQSLIEYLQKFLQLRSTLPQATPEIFVLTDKMISQIGKFYLDLQKSQILHFVLARGSMDVIRFYWGLVESYVPGSGGAGGSSDLTYQKFLLQALILLKNVLKNSEFSVINRKDMEEKMGQVKTILSTQLLTEQFVVRATEVLVGRYLAFSEQELEMWRDEPEAFVQEEDSDHWEFALRKCAEKVLMNMVSSNRAVLSPVLIGMLTHVMGVEGNDPKSILLKDAVYAIAGLCAHDLYDYVDFDSWFRSRLIAEARLEGPNQNILRRRVAWLMGCWVPVKASSTILPDVFTLLLNLMEPNEDMVVRLTAVLHLQHCVDTYEFDPIAFVGYLERTLELSCALMAECEELEVKMKVLSCLSVVVERMEKFVSPFAGRVTQLLPGLWEQSEREEMFRAAIVGTLGKLVGVSSCLSF